MASKMKPIFVVKVLDRESKKLANAAVELSLGAHRLQLTYDKRTGCYESRDFKAGRYIATVSAPGLQPDSREVTVHETGGRETFVLGEKGLPFYYRGKVKIPFKPGDELIGLTVRSRNKESMDPQVDALAEKLGLKEVEQGKDIRAEGLRTFQYPASASDEDKGKILVELNRSEAIEHAGRVIALGKDGISFMSDMIVAKFKGHITEDDVSRIAKKLELEVVRHIPYAGNGYQLRGKQRGGFELLDSCQKLIDTGTVEWAEPDLVYSHVDDLVPDDFLYAQQGHHQIIGSEDAWDTALGDANIIVAAVDRGLDLAHPDFAGTVAPGVPKIYSPYDFQNMDANTTNAGSTHGSRVCGVLAADADNSEGVAGIASGCQLMPIQRPSGSPDSTYADAYVWIAGFDPNSPLAGFPTASVPDPGADVISNSFGKPFAAAEAAISGVMQEALDYITTYGRGGRGCVVVFSTGNDDTDFTTYRQWAAYGKTIAVGSSAISPPDPAEVKVDNSNFGQGIDLCAPGGGTTADGETRTMSTSNVGAGSTAGSAGAATNDYESFGQTSCACPQVSATAALMLSAAPNLNWVEVRQILRDTAVMIDAANADPTGQWVDSDGDGVNDYSQWYGFGRLDTAAAVTAADAYPFDRDVLIRDNEDDDGSVPQGAPWWQGFDIWVRNTDPAIEGAAALPADYDTHVNTMHEAPLFGQPNWVYARFRNIGGTDSYNFYVRFYVTHFAGAEFLYPDDFIPSNRPGDPVPAPLVPGTYLIGETQYNSLPGGADDVVAVEWSTDLIPPETVDVDGTTVSWHPCLLVEISPHDGPTASGPNVWDSNNIAQKNLSIVYPEVGPGDDDFASFGAVGTRDKLIRELELEILRPELIPKARVYVRFLDRAMMKFIAGQLDRNKDLEHSTYKDKEVFWLADKNKVRVRIPNKGLQGVIIGGLKGGLRKGDHYVIELNQYDDKGKPRGAFALDVRLKGAGRSSGSN